ncbi:MAG: hypothetical protein AB2813_04235 [Candidatus Sedimenticola endophacoides]
MTTAAPPHGLIFHHFHGTGYHKSQGAIAASTLRRIIEHYQEHCTLLQARDYLEKSRQGRLRPGEVCPTFDDSLRCQYDIALPELERLGLTAFWFIYSSVLTGKPETLEIFRRFRSEHFDDIDQFYHAFYRHLDDGPLGIRVREGLADFDPGSYLSALPFYSEGDRRFRYVRDRILGPSDYDRVMYQMIEVAGTSPERLAQGLWMKAGHLRKLHAGGHVIGLHSHTHPTALARLDRAERKRPMIGPIAPQISPCQ